MKLNLKTKTYQHLIALLQKRSTGSANDLATSIGVSRTSLFSMLDELRSMGVDIEYNPMVKSYEITNNKSIRVNMPIEVIDR